MRSILDEWDVASVDIPIASRGIETVRWTDDTGPLVIAAVATPAGSRYRLRHADEIIVDVVSDRKLEVQSRPGTAQSTIDHFLTDQVIPRLLAHHGDLVLHAGAVRVGGQAILLVGESGRGKSTLAASLDRSGFPLLGDDATLILELDGMPAAKAVYPSLRLFPDSVDAVIPEGVEQTPMAHYSDKQRLAVPLPAQPQDIALPIRAMFIIDPPADDDRVTIVRRSTKEACMSLVEQSFSLDPADITQARRRLANTSRLAAQIPAFGLSYPRVYDRLPQVREAMLATLVTL